MSRFRLYGKPIQLRSEGRALSEGFLDRAESIPSVEARILELRANGDGILKIGRTLGVGTSVVQRVFKQEPWQP